MTAQNYAYREVATGSIRNRGHVERCPSLVAWDDVINGSAEAYTSAYLFSEALVSFVATTGSVRGFDGPCRAEGLVFDLDGPSAFADCRRLVERLLQVDTGLHCDNVWIWFSGRKGFHVLARSHALDGLPPSREVPGQMKQIATALAGGLQSFDTAIYDRLRLFRRANSRHPKSKLYKVPLTIDEVFTLNNAAVRVLARRPRSFSDAVAGCIAANLEEANVAA